MNSFSQSSNYRVGISILGDDVLYAQNITVPGLNFTVPEASSRGGSRVIFGGDSVLYDTIVIDLILDSKLQIYKNLITEVHKYINPNNGTFSGKSFTCWVDIADSFGKSLIKLEYFDCYLESVSGLDFTSAEDQEMTLSLTIRFDNFEIQDSVIPELKI